MKKFQLLLLAIFFIACSNNSKVYLDSSSAGTIDISLDVNAEFVKIRKDVLRALGGDVLLDKPLFPLDEIKKFFNEANLKGLKLKSISSNNNKMSLSLEFDDLSLLLADYIKKEEKPLIKVLKMREGIEIDINLERGNLYKTLEENEYVISNDVIAGLLPSEDMPMTAREYSDVIEYFLSSFTKNTKTLLNSSNLSITIQVPRAIKKQRGFKEINKNTLYFSTSFINALSLERAINLYLLY